MKKKSLKQGASIIELVVVFALSALLLPVFLSGLTSSREGKAQQVQRVTANSILKEAQEVVRSIKNNSWSSFSTNGTYAPVISSNQWTLSPGTLTENGYTTSVLVSDVYRDASGIIVTTGGYLDPSTKRVLITVSWQTPSPSSVSSEQYFTRFQDNLTHTHTTLSEFESGSAGGTAIVETSGSSIPGDGEIILGAGGRGNWCVPNFSTTTVDLPKSGVANAVYAIEGNVFSVTGENASGVSFAKVTVDNTNPPTAAVSGTFDGYKTNGVFGEAGYAYIATDTNSKEVVIIDLNQLDPITLKYAEAGYFDVPGNTDAQSIAVSGQVGYVTAYNTLYTFDLSGKTGSRTLLGSRALAGNGTRIVVNGNYAYVSISGSSTTEMQIIQVSNGGATLTVVGQANVNSQSATDIIVNSSATRAYLATAVSATQRELFVLDISSKSGDRPTLGSYESNGMSPLGISITTGNRLIMGGNGGEEYQVINISNEALPVRCGGIEVPSSVRGLSAVLEADGDAYTYIITGDASSELKIIEGGPGGQFATNGTYVSNFFDNGNATAFNRFTAWVSQPPQTSITMQVAVANAVDGACTNAIYTFIGPDPDNPTTSYFTPVGESISGSVPFISTGSFVNPGRCFKYRITMTTSDISNTPVVNDFIVNYSP